MPLSVTYERGTSSYSFTDEEILQLESIRFTLEQDVEGENSSVRADIGLGYDAYSTILRMISDEIPTGIEKGTQLF